MKTRYYIYNEDGSINPYWAKKQQDEDNTHKEYIEYRKNALIFVVVLCSSILLLSIIN